MQTMPIPYGPHCKIKNIQRRRIKNESELNKWTKSDKRLSDLSPDQITGRVTVRTRALVEDCARRSAEEIPKNGQGIGLGLRTMAEIYDSIVRKNQYHHRGLINKLCVLIEYSTDEQLNTIIEIAGVIIKKGDDYNYR